jgi:adenine-specific DNA-methyltransferase
MNYIGSKFSLLKFLDDSITEVAGEDRGVFLDLFAGTGAVGAHFKKKGYSVIANDFQYYAYVLNRHYIGNRHELPFKKLTKEIPALKLIKNSERKDFVCNYLSVLKGKRGFIYRNYCLGGTRDKKIQRQYYSDENGMRCDAIRQQIESWKAYERITDDEYFFLLASLIESIDKYANTASVYGAFLKHLKASAARSLVLKPAELILSKKKHKVYCQEINSLVGKVKGDILYLDPPYNHRQYATNYHLLETIARYDNPKIYGKTGLREYQDQKSLYATRGQVKNAFKELILSAKAKYIFLSYNNEGLMTPADVKQIMSLRGKYGYFSKEHGRFRADKLESRNHKAHKTTEYLHYVVCK